MENKQTKNDSFRNMIKEWTVKDYFTPGIKAEVILDMLLSQFVGEMLYAKLKSKYDGKVDIKPEDFCLIAKEFPLDNNKPNLSNAKVDYLISDEKNKILYFVELKTTKGSFDKNQYKRYLKYIDDANGVEKLFDLFKRIIKKYIKPRSKVLNKAPINLSNTQKYVMQLDFMQENMKDISGIPMDKISEPELAKDFVKAVKKHFVGETEKDRYQLKLIYLSLLEASEVAKLEAVESGVENKVFNIVISNLLDDNASDDEVIRFNNEFSYALRQNPDKVEQWECVKDIFQSIISMKRL